MEFFYRCSECDREYDISPQIMLCPECQCTQEPNRPLRGVLEVIRRETTSPGITPAAASPPRWIDHMPVEPEYFPAIPVGNTPMWRPERLRQSLGIGNLFLKDDTANPTGSLKDRASLLVAAFAKKHSIVDIVVASTGNAGSSMAGIGAAAGLNVRLFVPHSAPRAKLVQALQYGAAVVRVQGTYDDAYRESTDYVATHGGLSRNTGYNPLTIEGKKSAAYEILADLGKVPDFVFLPVGDGVIIGGVYKGFEDLVNLGVAEKVPTIVAVQAEGSSAIARALEDGEFTTPVRSATIADSIAVDVPCNGYYALDKLQQHNGRCIVVTDDQITDAQKRLSEETGLFAEPAAAAAFAGVLSAAAVHATAARQDDAFRAGELEDATVVLLITGSGLKDIDAAEKGVSVPP